MASQCCWKKKKKRESHSEEKEESRERDDGGGVGHVELNEVALEADDYEEEDEGGEENMSPEEFERLREKQDERWRETAKELQKPVKIHNILFAEPEVLRAVQRIHARIALLNLSVRRVHSDGGREFTNKAYKARCASRDIHVTYSPPSDPRANGRIEGAVGQVRAGVRALLSVRSDIPKRHWPSALRQFVAQRFELSMKELGGPPTKRQLVPFGTPVTVQSRNWSRKTPYASRATSGISLLPCCEYLWVHGCSSS